jgi:hypothetical protein
MREDRACTQRTRDRSLAMKPVPTFVTIDEIRLHGFDPRKRSAIVDAVARELTQLFTARPARLRGREVARVDGGSFAAGRHAAPSVVGAGIAASVHREVRTKC